MSGPNGELRALPSRASRRSGGRLDLARRRNRILELRAAGLTTEQIAEDMEMRPGSVSAVIKNALDRWSNEDGENIERIRVLKLYELDQLKRAIWPRALRGELAAVREASKIIQAQARISGAEAPRKVEATVGGAGLDSEQIDRMEAAWLNSTEDEGGAADGPALIEGTVRDA